MSVAESDDLTAWTEALDTFEQRIEEFRAVLEPEGMAPEGLWPPPTLVGRPLPPELADRVRALLKRSEVVEAELRTRQQQLPKPQRAHTRHRRNRRSSISTVL